MREVIEKYVEKFGENPNIIGMFWNDQNKLIQNILNAIKTGKKYDELDLLSESELKDYKRGKLEF